MGGFWCRRLTMVEFSMLSPNEESCSRVGEFRSCPNDSHLVRAGASCLFCQWIAPAITPEVTARSLCSSEAILDLRGPSQQDTETSVAFSGAPPAGGAPPQGKDDSEPLKSQSNRGLGSPILFDPKESAVTSASAATKDSGATTRGVVPPSAPDLHPADLPDRSQWRNRAFLAIALAVGLCVFIGLKGWVQPPVKSLTSTVPSSSAIAQGAPIRPDDIHGSFVGVMDQAGRPAAMVIEVLRIDWFSPEQRVGRVYFTYSQGALQKKGEGTIDLLRLALVFRGIGEAEVARNVDGEVELLLHLGNTSARLRRVGSWTKGALASSHRQKWIPKDS